MNEKARELRLATESDVDLLLAFMKEFYAESGYPLDDAPARATLRALAGDRALGRIWLILHEDRPVGYVAVTFGFSLEYLGRDAFVDDLYIQPSFRQRGIGTRILGRVLDACRALQVRALHLEVERSNQTARALYRRHGFRDNERQLLTRRLAAGTAPGHPPTEAGS